MKRATHQELSPHYALFSQSFIVLHLTLSTNAAVSAALNCNFDYTVVMRNQDNNCVLCE